MGSQKKRRKSAPPAEETQQRKRGGQGSGCGPPAPLAWTSAGVQAVLPPDRQVLFIGRGTLAVQSGELYIAGRVIDASTGPLELAADARVGGPLVVEVMPGSGPVPLASISDAVFSITRIAGSTGCAAMAGSADGLAAPTAAGCAGSRLSRLGFEAWVDDDPSAPLALLPPPLWRQAAAEVAASLAAGAAAGAPPALIVICGAKKVGKSTFGRLLANTLLNQVPAVAYLDTDCGQPEFTPPGLVSLSLITAPVLGPPHMHLASPADTRFVGDLSPSGNPELYLSHIRSLYTWYCRHSAMAAAAAASEAAAGAGAGSGTPPPLVVNTHGWVKGMGFEVLVEMLAGLPVTHCIQIASGNPKKSLPPGAFWLPQAEAGSPAPPLCWLLPPAAGAEAGVEQQQQQPAASEASNRSLGPAASEGGGGGGARGRPALAAIEQRGLQWLAWAEQCAANCALPAAGTSGGASGGPSGEGLELGDMLASALPFEADLADLEVQALGCALPPSQLCRALNGTVVGLCTAAQPEKQPPPPPQQQQEPSLPCLGLGLVRAVDAARGTLQLLTPVPEAELERVRVLQVGRLELPAALLQTPRCMSPYLSLFGMSTVGTGSGAIKSRGNLVRASQL